MVDLVAELELIPAAGSKTLWKAFQMSGGCYSCILMSIVECHVEIIHIKPEVLHEGLIKALRFVFKSKATKFDQRQQREIEIKSA